MLNCKNKYSNLMKNVINCLKKQKKAAEKVEAAQAEAESIIRELRRMQKEHRTGIKEHELIDAKNAWRKLFRNLKRAKTCENRPSETPV